MFFVSILAFFVVIFLLASITVAIAWMAFLKSQAEDADAADHAGGASGIPFEQASPLFRSDRLSTLNFWDSLLARFDFVEILKTRLTQAELDWSVGRVTLVMLLSATVSFLLCWKILPVWAALLAAGAVGFAPYGYILRVRRKRFDRFR